MVLTGKDKESLRHKFDTYFKGDGNECAETTNHQGNPKPQGLPEKLPEKRQRLIDDIIEKAKLNGAKLSENKIKILRLITDVPYISRSDIAKETGLSETSVYRNIEAMRGKYLRRVGPDKSGFWEIII